VSFVIAAEVDPDEASAFAACDDLANFASHCGSSLAPNRGTYLNH